MESLLGLFEGASLYEVDVKAAPPPKKKKKTLDFVFSQCFVVLVSLIVTVVYNTSCKPIVQ